VHVIVRASGEWRGFSRFVDLSVHRSLSPGIAKDHDDNTEKLAQDPLLHHHQHHPHSDCLENLESGETPNFPLRSRTLESSLPFFFVSGDVLSLLAFKSQEPRNLPPREHPGVCAASGLIQSWKGRGRQVARSGVHINPWAEIL
jgi:hypothetical protein